MKPLGPILMLALVGCESTSSDTTTGTTTGGGGEASTANASASSNAATSSGSGGSGGSDARGYDLDGDGTPETDLAVGPCVDSATLCLLVESSLPVPAQVALPEGSKPMGAGEATVIGPELQLIGDHVGGALSEVAVLFQLARGTHDSPALGVIDCEAGIVSAATSAPPTLRAFAQYALASFTTSLRDPVGRQHPILAPGYGDSDAVTWGVACLYDAASTGSGGCAAGFRPMGTVPSATSWFREVGGYVFDADADGWDDLTLLYHQRVRTLSGADGALLSETEYDVAASDEPGSPPWFHSGRNYGTHAAFESAGIVRTVMVGGTPVGAFDDALCNVSRFLGALDLPIASPASRNLAWADYFGFHSTLFSVYNDPAYAADPSPVVARAGDFTDGCIHRFSDSLVVIDGAPALVVNVFDADEPVDRCLVEQYALYLDPPWTQEKADAWYACAATNDATLGRWGMQARHRATGASITGSTDSYVWGWSNGLLGTGELTYLVETFAGPVRFDRMDVPPSPLSVRALVNGLWADRGTLPLPGPPKLVPVPAAGARGVGSFTAFVELSHRDADADGILEIELASGEWVEWDGVRFAVYNQRAITQ
jgi:hypothetical protein